VSLSQPTAPRALAAALLAATLLFAAALPFAAWRHRARPVASLPPLPAAFAGRVPARFVWAWEEPEDLRALPPTVGVAWLAETDLLTGGIAVLPRRQPLAPAPGAPLIAVVRIEARPGFADTPQLRAALAAHLAQVAAARPGIRALQLDFDAAASQRAFYRGVLEQLRPRLPASLPLSITALVSWCGPSSWLHTLPIDEAVPMEFRMGGPSRLARLPHAAPFPITEPLCRTSLGLSTDEPWPSPLSSAIRVYLFAPHPWQPAALAAFATQPLTTLAQDIAR